MFNENSCKENVLTNRMMVKMAIGNRDSVCERFVNDKSGNFIGRSS